MFVAGDRQTDLLSRGGVRETLNLRKTLMSLFENIKFPKNRVGETDENKIQGITLKNQARKNYLTLR